MVEDTKAEETVDTAETKSTALGETEETTESESLTEETTEKEETAEVPEEKGKPSEAPAEEKPAAEISDEPKEKTEDSDLTDFVEGEEPEKKSGLEKRIDKLTAEKYQLQARLAELEKERKTPSGERIYSEAELDQAERKAHEAGDVDLLTVISKERMKNLERRLEQKYREDQMRLQEQAKKSSEEWSIIRQNYQHFSAPNAPEIYPGARKELDITNQNSTLVRLARMLYGADEETLIKIFGFEKSYRVPGGQQIAISDALNLILRKRKGGGPENKEAKKLKKQLAKEKRKRGLGTSGAEKEEITTPSKPKTPDEILNSYIKERNKTKLETLGLSE